MSLKKAIKELKLDREKEVLEMIDRKIERDNAASFKALKTISTMLPNITVEGK